MSGNQQSQEGQHYGRTKVPSNRGGILTILRQVVTKVEGPSEGKVDAKLKYRVTEFRYNDSVPIQTEDRVKWDIKIGDNKKELTVKGKEIEIDVQREWSGEEIIVMPYLVRAIEAVSVKTKCYILDHDILKNDMKLNRIAIGETETLGEGQAQTICRALKEFNISDITDKISRTGEQFFLENQTIIDGIKLFQKQYMDNGKGAGKIEKETILAMNQALHEKWKKRSTLLSERVRMGEHGIPKEGPCLAMSYLGIAQTYAGRNLWPSEVKALIDDGKIYIPSVELSTSSPEVVIKAGLNKLGVKGTEKIKIREDRVTNKADINAFATVLHVGTKINPDEAGHFQEGSNKGAFVWDPLDGTASDRKIIKIRNIYIKKDET